MERNDQLGSYWKRVELRLLQFILEFPDFGSGGDSLFPQIADYRVGSATELHEGRFAFVGIDAALHGGTNRRLDDPNQNDSRRKKRKGMDI